jgi:outer membrane biosynthesis protein TonB
MSGRIRMAMACTGVLLVTAASARAQTAFRETGSLTVGGYLVWVRGTNAKVVELFVGRGFRDAFAKAHDMDEARLQQWIDSVRAVQPVPADDSSSSEAQLRGAALGADVTMMRRVGGSYSGLRVLVSGEEPIKMAEPTARDFIAMLDSAARVTRELSVPPPTIMASMPMRDGAPPVSAPPASAPPASAPPASAPTPAPEPTPAAAPTPAPELVLPTPSERLAPVGAAPAPVAMPSPAIAAPEVVVAAVGDTAVPPHVDAPADKLIRTPLGPFTVPGALLSDRDKEAQYCYTQLGLKYSPDLRGEITVRLSLRTDGAVEDAVVIKRSWQGISAGEVESCVRALAHDWTFASNDPSVAGGAKSLTFSFAP